MPMSKVKKTLLISGSPRKGNCEFIFSELQKLLDHDSELILLRKENIQHCKWCLYCHNIPDCSIKDDDMWELRKKILDASFIVIGSPNYFDNISGLLKNFIDRLHPFYKEELLKGKKIIEFMVGGGKDGTQQSLESSMNGLVKYLHLDLKGSYRFQALHANDISSDNEAQETIKEMASEINLL